VFVVPSQEQYSSMYRQSVEDYHTLMKQVSKQRLLPAFMEVEWRGSNGSNLKQIKQPIKMSLCGCKSQKATCRWYTHNRLYRTVCCRLSEDPNAPSMKTATAVMTRPYAEMPLHGGKVQEFEPSEHSWQIASSLPFINSTLATTIQNMINTSCTRQNTTRSEGCEVHHSAARDFIE